MGASEDSYSPVARRPTLEPLAGAVFGAVVDGYDLEVAQALPIQTPETVVKIPAGVVHREQHRDQGLGEPERSRPECVGHG